MSKRNPFRPLFALLDGRIAAALLLSLTAALAQGATLRSGV